MARTSCGLFFSANTDVREATRSPSTLARATINSSVMPSLRYSFSGSELAFTKGSTAILRVAVSNTRARRDASPASAAMNSATVRKRCAGSFASARPSVSSTPVGTSGRSIRTGRGLSVTCFAIVARGLSPRSGGCPASIS